MAAVAVFRKGGGRVPAPPPAIEGPEVAAEARRAPPEDRVRPEPEKELRVSRAVPAPEPPAAKETESAPEETIPFEEALRANHIRELERTLRSSHGFFSKVGFTVIQEPPLAFFVAKPLRDDPAYPRAVAAEFAGCLRDLERRFREEYAEPLRLERRPERTFYPVAVLPSRGVFRDDYSGGLGADPESLDPWAHYEPQLRLVVTYKDAAPLGADRERRESVLRRFALAVEEAYTTGQVGLPKPLWFAEGLADRLARVAAGPDDDPLARRSAAARMKLFAETLRSAAAGVYAAPIRELVALEGPGWKQVSRAAENRAKKLRSTLAFSEILAVEAFRFQSALLVEFLLRDAGGRRSKFFEYAGRAMRGRSGLDLFAEAFGDSFPKLQEDFDEFVRSEHERLCPGDRPLPRLPDLEVLERLGKSDGAGGGEETEPPFAPEDLRLKPAEWKAALGLALRDAGRGAIDEARSDLGKWRASFEGGAGPPEGDAARARIDREIGRLREASELRKTFLAAAAAEGGAVKLGERSGRVEGADLERCIARVRIGGSVEEVPFAKLSADDLFASAKKHFAGSRAWVGGYIALLAGQAPNRVRRLVYLLYLSNRESPEVRDVLQDLADFEDLLRWGEAAASLRSLSEGYEAASASRDRARSSLEDLRALLVRHGASPIVAARRKALRACAAQLLGCLFDPGDRGCLGLRGRIERRDENKIRVTYEFDEPEEQDDFVSDDGYLREWRRELMESFDFLKPSPESLSSTSIVDGALRTNGQTCFRFALPLEAPFEVRGTLSFGGVKFGGDRPFGGFVLGACDDGRGGNIRCLQTGDILAYDGGEFRQARGQRSADFLAGQPYEFHFVHSGSTAGYAIGNSKTALAGVENLKSGGLFFWVHSNVSVQIGRLEIEASLTERVVVEMRRRWVGTQLRKIFGP